MQREMLSRRSLLKSGLAAGAGFALSDVLDMLPQAAAAPEPHRSFEIAKIDRSRLCRLARFHIEHVARDLTDVLRKLAVTLEVWSRRHRDAAHYTWRPVMHDVSTLHAQERRRAEVGMTICAGP